MVCLFARAATMLTVLVMVIWSNRKACTENKTDADFGFCWKVGTQNLIRLLGFVSMGLVESTLSLQYCIDTHITHALRQCYLVRNKSIVTFQVVRFGNDGVGGGRDDEYLIKGVQMGTM